MFFRVVVHSKVNTNDYSTLSHKGVTRLRNGKEVEFVDVEQWIRDYEHFNQLLKIKSFAMFRIWKAFFTWRKNVRTRYVMIKVLHSCSLKAQKNVHNFSLE